MDDARRKRGSGAIYRQTATLKEFSLAHDVWGQNMHCVREKAVFWGLRPGQKRRLFQELSQRTYVPDLGGGHPGNRMHPTGV